MNKTSQEEPLDPRVVANEFIRRHLDHKEISEETEPHYTLTRPLLERLVVFSNDLYEERYGTSLVGEKKVMGEFEPFFQSLRTSLGLYGIEEVDAPIIRGPVALSYILRHKEFSTPYIGSLSQQQREFLDLVWQAVTDNRLSATALLWENLDFDRPNEPDDLAPPTPEIEIEESLNASAPVPMKLTA